MKNVYTLDVNDFNFDTMLRKFSDQSKETESILSKGGKGSYSFIGNDQQRVLFYLLNKLGESPLSKQFSVNFTSTTIDRIMMLYNKILWYVNRSDENNNKYYSCWLSTKKLKKLGYNKNQIAQFTNILCYLGYMKKVTIKDGKEILGNRYYIFWHRIDSDFMQNVTILDFNEYMEN